MLIDDVSIELLAWNDARFTWSGTAGATVRAYINGLLAYGPKTLADADKSLVINLPDVYTVEIHENDADDTVPPASIPLQRKPFVWWSSRADAKEYRIYSAGVLLGVVRHDASKLHHEYQVASDLRQDGGVWTGLRVEAVTLRGRESVRAEFPVFAPGVPAAPSGVHILGNGGIFTIVLGDLVPLRNEFGQQMYNEFGQPMYAL